MDIFELLQAQGRIYEFGDRTIFNDNLVSILVKNMSKDDDERGRARDYIAVILEGLEARYRDVLRHRVLNMVFQQLQSLAIGLVGAIEQDIEAADKLVGKMTTELRLSFHTLDLTDEQENHFSAVIEETLNSKDNNEISSGDIHERISAVIQLLSSTIESLEVGEPAEAGNHDDDTIEFF
jgi:transcriptional regulator NrdR family protein